MVSGVGTCDLRVESCDLKGRDGSWCDVDHDVELCRWITGKS